MAVSNKGKGNVRQDLFSSTLRGAVGNIVSPNNTQDVPLKEENETKEIEEMQSTITIDPETSNSETQAPVINLANKVHERVRKEKPKKHKIGGYITEELYQKVHDVCEEKDISLSDLFQAVLSEYVESVE